MASSRVKLIRATEILINRRRDTRSSDTILRSHGNGTTNYIEQKWTKRKQEVYKERSTPSVINTPLHVFPLHLNPPRLLAVRIPHAFYALHGLDHAPHFLVHWEYDSLPWCYSKDSRSDTFVERTETLLAEHFSSDLLDLRERGGAGRVLCLLKT